MKQITAWTFVALAACAAACGNDPPKSTGPSAQPAAAATTALATPSAAPAATTEQAATAEPAAASAAADAPPTEAASAAPAGPKTYDCGAKGQKPCPMQGWMKSVMANASSSGDGAKLAAALSYVASHAPPGFANWSSIASAGAAKAKAGDIDGAKATCKQCHDAHKATYKATLRDRPF